MCWGVDFLQLLWGVRFFRERFGCWRMDDAFSFPGFCFMGIWAFQAPPNLQCKELDPVSSPTCTCPNTGPPLTYQRKPEDPSPHAAQISVGSSMALLWWPGNHWFRLKVTLDPVNPHPQDFKRRIEAYNSPAWWKTSPTWVSHRWLERQRSLSSPKLCPCSGGLGGTSARLGMPRLGQRNIVLGGWQLGLQEVFGQCSRSRVVIQEVVLCRARGWIWWSLCAPSSPGNSEPVNCWDLPCGGHRVLPGVPKTLIIHHWPPRTALSLLHRGSTLHYAPAGEIFLLSKEINLYTFSSHKLMIPSDQKKMT